MTSKFWLYLGIILACSGIGTGVGIFLIILYVWGDIREAIDNNNVVNNTGEEKRCNAKYYDDETIDEMK
jgi:hypothetical protein